MKEYECVYCGMRKLALAQPASLHWEDGHICNFFERSILEGAKPAINKEKEKDQ